MWDLIAAAAVIAAAFLLGRPLLACPPGAIGVG
jgi:hypothetical protein